MTVDPGPGRAATHPGMQKYSQSEWGLGCKKRFPDRSEERNIKTWSRKRQKFGYGWNFYSRTDGQGPGGEGLCVPPGRFWAVLKSCMWGNIQICESEKSLGMRGVALATGRPPLFPAHL